MKGKFFATISILLITIVLFSPLALSCQPGPSVEDRIVDENVQMASVSVSETGENIKLFINLASTDPGENISLIVPVGFEPERLNTDVMSGGEFLKSNEISYVKELSRKQSDGYKRFRDDMAGTAFLTTFLESMGSMLFYDISGNICGEGGPSSSTGYMGYEPRISPDVETITFDSSDSLHYFCSSYGVSVPPNENSFIEEHGSYTMVIINTTTVPPIEEEKFEALEENVPDIMDRFRENASAFDSLWYYRELIGDVGPPFMLLYRDIAKEVTDPSLAEELQEYFEELVFSSYGTGSAVGLQISMKLPLDGGKVSFHSAMSPQWDRLDSATMIFSTDYGHSISFSEDTDEAFHDWRHTYILNAEDDGVDYTIYGEFSDTGSLKEAFGARLSGFLYEWGWLVALTIMTLLFAALWAFILVKKPLREKTNRNVNGKHIFLVSVAGSVLLNYLFDLDWTVTIIMFVIIFADLRMIVSLPSREYSDTHTNISYKSTFLKSIALSLTSFTISFLGTLILLHISRGVERNVDTSILEDRRRRKMFYISEYLILGSIPMLFMAFNLMIYDDIYHTEFFRKNDALFLFIFLSTSIMLIAGILLAQHLKGYFNGYVLVSGLSVFVGLTYAYYVLTCYRTPYHRCDVSLYALVFLMLFAMGMAIAVLNSNRSDRRIQRIATFKP